MVKSYKFVSSHSIQRILISTFSPELHSATLLVSVTQRQIDAIYEKTSRGQNIFPVENKKFWNSFAAESKQASSLVLSYRQFQLVSSFVNASTIHYTLNGVLYSK